MKTKNTPTLFFRLAIILQLSIFFLSVTISSAQVNVEFVNKEDFIVTYSGSDCGSEISLWNNTRLSPYYKNDIIASDSLFISIAVDLYSDGNTDYFYSSFLPADDDEWDDTNGDGIPDQYIRKYQVGENININLPFISGSVSHHKVTWKATNQQNNNRILNQEFLVVDGEAPQSVLLDTLTKNYSPEDEFEVFASEFFLSSIDNCSDPEDIRYSFSPLMYEPSLSLDCSYALDTFRNITLYALDERGNAEKKEAILEVQNLSCYILPFQVLKGNVKTVDGTGISDVEIILDAPLPGYPRTTTTDELGDYQFDHLLWHVEYTVSARKKDTYHPELSIEDYHHLEQHILGNEPFSLTKYYLASDINADQVLDIRDLQRMRKIILGILPDEIGYNSWYFLTDPSILETDIPFPYDGNDAYSERIQPSSTDYIVNFIGIKIGEE